MDPTLSRRLMCLPANGDTAHLDLDRRTLRVRRGRVWLTQHRDANDYVLGPGDELRIASEGAVVIHAIVDAEIEVLRNAAALTRWSALVQACMRLARRGRTVPRTAPSSACPR